MSTNVAPAPVTAAFSMVLYGKIRTRKAASARCMRRSTAVCVRITVWRSGKRSSSTKRGARSRIGRPTSPSITLNSLVAAGVTLVMRSSRSTKMVAICVPR
jgi:hypothetical protein